MDEEALYCVSQKAGIAYCTGEYGTMGYDPRMGDFIAPIDLETEREIRKDSVLVGYAKAIDFAMAMIPPRLLPEAPSPDGEAYDTYKKQIESGEWAKRVAVQRMATLAYERHKGQYRKWPDGRPYIVHPQAVYDMLCKKWGYTEENDVVSLCVAWGHDLLEDAESEDREAIEKEIVSVGGKWGEEVLTGIRTLSLIIPKGLSDEEYDKRKNAYMEGIADNAPLAVLVVKMADRLCNTLDFAQSDKGKARGYLGKGMCLFRRLGQMPRPDLIRKSLAEVEAAIRDS